MIKPYTIHHGCCLDVLQPPGGVCLDPFLGSGTTAVAALQGGFRCIGIERDEHSCQAANARVLAEYLNSF